MKIRPKIQIALLGIGLIPMLLFGWFNLDRATSVLATRLTEHLQAVAAVQVKRIEMLIDRNLERLKLVSSRTQLRLNLAKHNTQPDPTHQASMIRILKDARNSITSFNTLSVINPQGQVVASTDETWIGRNLADQETFLMGQLSNRADFFGIDSEGNLIVLLAGPLILNDETIGVILVAASGQDFIAVTQSYDGLGESGETIIVRPGSNETLQYLTPLRFDAEATLTLVDSDTPGYPLLQAALQPGSPESQTSVDYRNQEVLAVTRTFQIPGTGAPGRLGSTLGLVIKRDVSEVFALVHQLRLISLIILGITLVVVLGVSLILANSITRPIRHLLDTANQIGAGDLDRRATVEGEDEIADLARDFNEMAEQLTIANRGLEEKVKQRTRELETSNQELEQFAYVASHDLKEPLRMVTSYLQLLESRYSGKLDSEAREFIGYAVDGADRMKNLIEDLLQLSRVGTKGRELKPVSADDALKAALANLQAAMRDRQATIRQGTLPEVMGDPLQLVQLFQNLIGNALKFCPPDRSPVIEIEAVPREKLVEFRIQDNGIGIAKDQCERVFQIFQRLCRRDEYEGTGIGLAICRRIVERHGGSIHIEPAAGQGSVFVFTLRRPT